MKLRNSEEEKTPVHHAHVWDLKGWCPDSLLLVFLIKGTGNPFIFIHTRSNITLVVSGLSTVKGVTIIINDRSVIIATIVIIRNPYRRILNAF